MNIYDFTLKYDYDFLIPKASVTKSGIDIFLDFKVRNSKYLMIRGGKPYAMYDFDTELWTTDKDRMIDILDSIVLDLADQYRDAMSKAPPDNRTFQAVHPLIFSDASTKRIDAWKKYTEKQMWDNWHQLDQTVIFQNTEVHRDDYASFRLDYSLEDGSIENYKNLFEPLFAPDELRKLEWGAGAIISGASKRIQKMFVLFGEGGTGKSTWMNLLKDDIFSNKSDKKGYTSVVSVKALCNGFTFALEPLKNGPLISVDDDAKLNKIEDNTELNSVVSHATKSLNAKYESLYETRFNTMIFCGTNTPVQISDGKSGLLRRIIDVQPTGFKHDYKSYMKYLRGMKFEKGAIAKHCLDVFNELGEDYYESYVPIRMMSATNYFYDFLDYNYDYFKDNEFVLLSEVWKRYQDYVTKSALKFSLNRLMVKNQLQDYFDIYKKEARIDGGKHVRDYYSGFKYWKFDYVEEDVEEKKGEESDEGTVEEEFESWLKFDKRESLFDKQYADCLAQLASSNDIPMYKWETVTTTLADIDTSKVHYVRIPLYHIVIDFDLKDETGQKSFLLNWKAASQFPPTYAELSKGGEGIHLHYLYSGDVDRLARLVDKDIEIKVFKGGASLRRRLSKCNDIPIATISSGLPLREVKKTISDFTIKSERMLRKMIIRNLKKEYHDSTASSVKYIYKLLEDAYESGLSYDVSDLEKKVISFAGNSTNQSQICLKLCTQMHFKSDEPSANHEPGDDVDDRLIFFDVEVFPNLFVICWKFEGGDNVYSMINPSAREVEDLFKYKLVGFNNRGYDNYILYAASMGYTVHELYELSQDIINEHKKPFNEAKNLSYTDVYDFASAGNKKSLKKFEIELGIHHQEIGIPWDKPVSEDLWSLVVEYCCNDVRATEAVFHHLKGDWTARQILAELSGLTVNDSTNAHSTAIIFGSDPNPQSQFIYTDLSTIFPGYTYTFDKDKNRYVSMYRGEDPGEGGYVYAEPGMATNVCVLDIASMHPSSIRALNLFGDEYTQRFVDILDARVLIKHSEWDKARKILDGKLAPYLDDETQADNLSNALKTVINSVYGLTSAKFPNKFKDTRNVDNIVAKRGALFMINLKHEVQERGFQVLHIKTDSIKIPNATPEIIQFVMDYGKKYGYTFEHESTYEKICLINNAVYIAQYATPEKCEHMYGYVPAKNAKAFKKEKFWDATGAQFAQPYVFKTLFSHEEIEWTDLAETKSTTTALYLDMNEGYPNVEYEEKQLDKIKKKWQKSRAESTVYNNDTFETTTDPEVADIRDELMAKIALGHNYSFVGRVGSFIPVKKGGGLLLRKNGDSYAYATGASGHRWLETESIPIDISNVDTTYHEALVDAAIEAMAKFGDVEWFLSDDISPEPLPDFMCPDFMNIPEGIDADEIPFAV